MTPEKSPSQITISVDKRSYDGALQISINDETNGTGYRIAGPKYDGKGKRLLTHTLSKRDVDEICEYLKRVGE